MIGIGKNHKALVTIATLASLLIVNAITIGTGGHIALARHHDTTEAFENGGINIQTDTNQGQACETASGTSPISGSCIASSTGTNSQTGGVVQSPTQAPQRPSCTPTMHPTVLTLTAVSAPGVTRIGLAGTLTDTCTGSGVGPRAIITFTISPHTPSVPFGVTDAAGQYETATNAIPGTYRVQAHFNNINNTPGIFGPSNSAIETVTVP